MFGELLVRGVEDGDDKGVRILVSRYKYADLMELRASCACESERG